MNFEQAKKALLNPNFSKMDQKLTKPAIDAAILAIDKCLDRQKEIEYFDERIKKEISDAQSLINRMKVFAMMYSQETDPHLIIKSAIAQGAVSLGSSAINGMVSPNAPTNNEFNTICSVNDHLKFICGLESGGMLCDECTLQCQYKKFIEEAKKNADSESEGAEREQEAIDVCGPGEG